MSWFIPLWRKSREGQNKLGKKTMFVLAFFVTSPLITYVFTLGVLKRSMEEVYLFTGTHAIVGMGILFYFVVKEFMFFILWIRKDLLNLSYQKRINKSDIFNLLDEYYAGWEEIGKEGKK